MSGVQILTVAPGDGDQRLDRWMRRNFAHLSQGRIEKMCRKGEIRVDGGRVKPATRLADGQQVRIPPLPEPGETHATARAPRIAETDARAIQDAVLWKDDHIIALNKPPGLPSQGGSGLGTRHVDALAEALRFGLDDKPRLVHRLDKDTSGVLLLARSRIVAKALTDAFRARDTRKIYWAIAAGVPSPRMGTVKWGLVKASGHGGAAEKMRCVHPEELAATPGAKRAVTDYAVIQNLGQRVVWLALVPVTGRTHQLRAHMAEMGHPIIGDGKYGGSGQENLGDGWGASLGGEISGKLHLHARSISLDHPVTGKRLTITAPLPEHMVRSWATLGFDTRDAPDDPFEDPVWS